jgi:uncharacterized protein YdgA (DUF945 family)
LFTNESAALKNHNHSATDTTKISSEDIDKVQITLKQFARDWSSDGENILLYFTEQSFKISISVSGELEREQCYKPIIDEIVKHYNPSSV